MAQFKVVAVIAGEIQYLASPEITSPLRPRVFTRPSRDIISGALRIIRHGCKTPRKPARLLNKMAWTLRTEAY